MEASAAALELDERQKLANAALARKKRILERMRAMQMNFLKTHKKWFTVSYTIHKVYFTCILIVFLYIKHHGLFCFLFCPEY